MYTRTSMVQNLKRRNSCPNLTDDESLIAEKSDFQKNSIKEMISPPSSKSPKSPKRMRMMDFNKEEESKNSNKISLSPSSYSTVRRNSSFLSASRPKILVLENDSYRRLSGLSDISAMVLLSPSTCSTSSLSETSSSLIVSSFEKGSKEWYHMISKKIDSTIPVKNHTHYLKKYRNCFSGEACVSWLLGGEYATDVGRAIALAETLIKMGLIENVESKSFKLDGNHLLRIVIEDSNRTKKEATIAKRGLLESIPEDIEFHDLLAHKQYANLFEEWCVREFNDENLSFWGSIVCFRDALEKYKNSHEQMVDNIIKKYIAIDAFNQINIPAKLRNECMLQYKFDPVNPNIFDKAAEEIYSVMKKDSFHRFIRSIHSFNK